MNLPCPMLTVSDDSRHSSLVTPWHDPCFLPAKHSGSRHTSSLMLVTALSPVIGFHQASRVAHYALDHDLTLKEVALKLEVVSAAELDRIVDPRKMVKPYVAMT